MLRTETRNENTMHIDRMSALEIAQVMNQENMNSVMAVEKALPEIAKAIEAAAKAIAGGGKMIYIGAGTSGRLGIQDAAECPPTFGVEDWVVQGIIAGGKDRVFKAGENAEDIYEDGVRDVKDLLKAGDVLVGISAAGGAAFVCNALKYAKSLGCTTVGITSNPGSRLDTISDISIAVDTGAEVLTGSTRLKAGNVQKMVLNMLSTGAMARSGYVYENLMINLKPTNIKLRARVIRIVSQITGYDEESSIRLLEKSNWVIRDALRAWKQEE